jgi:hypothetical protein
MMNTDLRGSGAYSSPLRSDTSREASANFWVRPTRLLPLYSFVLTIGIGLLLSFKLTRAGMSWPVLGRAGSGFMVSPFLWNPLGQNFLSSLSKAPHKSAECLFQ